MLSEWNSLICREHTIVDALDVVEITQREQRKSQGWEKRTGKEVHLGQRAEVRWKLREGEFQTGSINQQDQILSHAQEVWLNQACALIFLILYEA